MKTRRLLLAIFVGWSLGASAVRAETQSVIDPTEGIEPSKPPAAAAKPAQPDAAVMRERQRAAAEQRRRARAEARALAAENESAKLRAMEQARQAEAAREAAAAKAAARKAAAAKAAAVRVAAARATQARIAAEREAATRENAAREAAARELAAREAAVREAAAREAAAREAAAREAAVREAAAREAAAREAAVREAAAREAAVRKAAVREAAAREAAEREAAEREAAARNMRVKFAPPIREARPSRAPQFGTVFRDCADCPQLVWLPQGEVVIGEAGNEARAVVAIDYLLAVGRFEVTFAEWDACVAGGGCRHRPDDSGWGRGWQPAINISWVDAQQYVAWLSRRTGKRYRLLSDAEWEYAARAGTDARYWWGNQVGRGDANCRDCGSKWDGRQAAPVGRFAPSPFGLYDMHGNVSEWVEDCYHDGHRNAPGRGRAGRRDCGAQSDARIVRGGAWHESARSIRSTSRSSAVSDYYDDGIGLRIARTE
jgi:formylglycine-generating enzyme required for sulfatase activity